MTDKEQLELNEKLIKAFSYYKPMERVKALLKAGADVNAKDEEGKTPLMMAGNHSEQIELIEALLKAGADVNAKDNYGRTPLICFVEHNRSIKVIEVLLKAGADVNVIDDYGRTAFGYARTDEQKALLQKAGQKQLNGKLLNAVEKNRPFEEIERYIEAGADVNAKDKDGKTAFDYVRTDEQRALLQKAMKKAEQKKLNEKLLHALYKKRPLKEIKGYIEAGADVNMKDKYGMTPLMWVRTENQMKLLIEAGADIYAKDMDGMSARDHAANSRIRDLFDEVFKKAEVKAHIEERKHNLLRSRKLRKVIEKRDGKLSGAVVADKIAEDVISGKEKRTITPEVGAEYRCKKALKM